MALGSSSTAQSPSVLSSFPAASVGFAIERCPKCPPRYGLVIIKMPQPALRVAGEGQATTDYFGSYPFFPPPATISQQTLPNTINPPHPLKKTGEPHPLSDPEVLGAEFSFNGTDKLSQSPLLPAIPLHPCTACSNTLLGSPNHHPLPWPNRFAINVEGELGNQWIQSILSDRNTEIRVQACLFGVSLAVYISRNYVTVSCKTCSWRVHVSALIKQPFVITYNKLSTGSSK